MINRFSDKKINVYLNGKGACCVKVQQAMSIS